MYSEYSFFVKRGIYMQEKDQVRIAHIVGKWVGGGVESVLMNYYRHIDRSKIQFDFFCDSDSTDIPYEEIENLGGKVILIPPYQHVYKYHKELKRLLEEGNYKIVHSHINTLSVFPLYAAKRAGVSIRIAHSHSTTNKKEKMKNLMKQILKPFSKVFATDYMSCSEHAGRWLFGNKVYDKGKVYLLNNAINLEKFKYDENIRKEKRDEMGIDKDTLVMGHIGRFVEQKNHLFLIDIFNEVYKKNKNSLLLLVGVGPLLNKVKEKVKNLNLEDNVLFLGQRSDVHKLYQVMDVFLLPSIYEGLGMVLIEAQCSGLACIASKEVPIDAKVTDLVQFSDFDTHEWCNKICGINKKSRDGFCDIIKEHGYDIFREVSSLEKKYLQMGKPNIAIITSGFLPVPASKGGAVENLLDIFNRKNEEYHKVNTTIFSTYDKDAYPLAKTYNYTKFVFIKDNIIIRCLDKLLFMFSKYVLKKENSNSYRYIIKRMDFFWKVSKYLKKNNYDKVILENHPTMYYTMKFRKNDRRYKNKVYYHCHNEISGTFGLDKYIRQTKIFFSVSHFMSHTLKSLLELDKSKFKVLKNCCDYEKVTKKSSIKEMKELKEKYGINKNDKVILFVGRIVKEKGVLELIEALSKVSYSNYKVLLLGSSTNALDVKTEYEREVYKKIQLLNGKVKMTGFIKHDELYKYYSLADICVIPSICNEAACLSLIESLSNGVATIITNSGGMMEYANLKTSIIVPKDDHLISNLAKSIDELLRDDLRREKMGEESLKQALNFTADAYYHNFINILFKK